MPSLLPYGLTINQLSGLVRKPLRNAMAAGFIALVIALCLPNQYTSEARILPADSRSGGAAGQMAAAAAAVGVTVPGQDSSDSAFVDILNSRWVAKSILLENYHFSTRRLFFLSPKERHESLYTYLKVANLDRGLKKMSRILMVKRDLKSKLLTISAQTESPELSQQIVRKAVAILEQFIQVKSRTRGGNKAAFTAERLKEAQAECDRDELRSEAFLNAHRNYATSNEPAVRLRGARLEAILKLRQQVVTTLTLNYEQALLEEKNDMPILNILDEGDVPIDKSFPPRSLLILLAFLLAGVGTGIWDFMRMPGRLRQLES